MKKVITLFLVFAVCLSLCACGNNKNSSPKLTITAVEEALADTNGKLDMETSGEHVTSFTYIMEDVNVDDLSDREYTINAINELLTGNQSKITLNQVKVCGPVVATMGIVSLLNDSDSENVSEEYLDMIFDVACNNETIEINGWTVSSQMDLDNDSIIISVVY